MHINLEVIIARLRWCKASMSYPRAACGSVEGFVLTSLGFCRSKCILHTHNVSVFW